jgi:elongation factor G
VAPIEVDGIRVHVLDTPGYADFAHQMALALSAVELAVVVVSATDGVAAQTLDAWRAAEELGLPRVIVINKLDRERADFDRVLEEIRTAFGAGVAPVELPIGQEADFRGVIDLFDDTATFYDLDAPAPRHGDEGPIPEDLLDTEHSVHEQLVEGIVVGDDDLMARYLEGAPIGRDELEGTLSKGVAAGVVFPVLCASATTGVGIDRLARLLVELCPTPAERRPALVSAGESLTEVPCDPDGPPLLEVVRTLSDPHAGKVTIAKVLSGTLSSDLVLTNPRSRADERLHALESISGSSTRPLTEAVAGDFVAIGRLSNTKTGDTLAPKTMPATVLVPEPESAPLAVAVRPASRADDDKLMSALARLCEEDPTISVERDDETHQTVLRVMGEVHLAVSLERLARKYGVNVEREELLIAYRETISAVASVEQSYKKQSGGHGQYAVVRLRLEPLGRGEGFEFGDEVVGGAIPRQYIPAVEKGVREAMAQGCLGGFPVVDVRAVVVDGKAHSVDSSEMSFKTAAAQAFHRAMEEAGPVLLEPIDWVSVTVPPESHGDVLGDLHARRARVQGTDTTPEGNQIISALVPEAELTRYPVDLRSLTGGRGRVRSRRDHYDVKA